MTSPPPAPGLRAHTVALSPPAGAELIAALPDLPAHDLLSWVRRGEGLVGWGSLARAEASGPDRFRALRTWWHEAIARTEVVDEVRLAGTGPVAFGSFAYAASSPAGAVLTVPQVVLGARGGSWWLTVMSVTGPADLSVTDQAQASTRHTRDGIEARLAGRPRSDRPHRPGDVRFADGALSPAQWAGRVAEAVAMITAGDLDKVVLARDLDVTTDAPLDARWLLTQLAQRYDNTWVFAVDGLVGATPEMLVRCERGLVTSRVLAGTIRRSGDDEHDLALAAKLARSSKDLEEHEYAVRSVADALRPHCSSMNVPESPFVLHLTNVMHLATDVAGVLHDGATSLALAEALHPSAAVCGTPTEVADRVIADLEGMDRGRYAGPVGWVDARGDGEWGIALRCGAVEAADPSRIRLYAGCGIVAGSDPAAEVVESDAKLVPMRDALTAP